MIPAFAQKSGRSLIWSGFLLAMAVIGTGSSSAAPATAPVVHTPREIAPALVACWRPPGGTEGLSATARFSFRRDGTLMGPPRITFSRLGDNDARARAFLLSIADAFVDCTPLNFSPSFGRSVAGRIFTLRFIPSARNI